MKNLDLDNIAHLDESFSNFRLFGIGKPSQKQADKWETKKPAKFARLVKKGKIAITPKEDTGTSNDNSITSKVVIEKENSSNRLSNDMNTEGMSPTLKWTLIGGGILLLVGGIITTIVLVRKK